MSKFDDFFEFRLARVEEIDEIMEFIAKYWPKKNSILSTNRDFFAYEFCKGNRVGYYLAKEKKTGEIAAGMGVYFYSEEFTPGRSSCSGGMVLANPTIKMPFIGLELLKRFFQEVDPLVYVSPGVNLRTMGNLILKYFNHDISRMKHYYMLNDFPEYKICKIAKKPIAPVFKDDQINMDELFSSQEVAAYLEMIDERTCKPYKDQWYINKRYFEHPVYKYKLWGIARRAVLVTREIYVNNAKILRIVDILGNANEIAKVGVALFKLMSENDYEYIDIYELNVDDIKLELAGFVERTESDLNVIPNYFEPFVQENVEIYVHRNDLDAVCFKGDGDQDRPNYVG